MKTAELYSKNEYCCGCSACKEACPNNAIELRESRDGFLFPVINEEKCIDCGACKNACRFQHGEMKNEVKSAWAGITKTTDIKKSSSGGVFAAAAKKFIENGGIVYGCAMVNDGGLTAKHIRCENAEELEKILGSKYVQSDIASAYSDAEADLKEGKSVLFSGTPCQIDGLSGYLKKDYENLYTADIICHGVPGGRLFRDYVSTLESKSRATSFIFRSNEVGGEMTSKVTFENGKDKLIPCSASAYFYLFINGYTYRESCYKCKYACKNRVGDVTLGDYWGVEKHHPGFNSKNGCSCIIVNTENGEKLFDTISDCIEYAETEFDFISENNAQLNSPSVMKPERNEIFSAYENEGFKGVEKIYNRLAGKSKYISKAKLIAKKILK